MNAIIAFLFSLCAIGLNVRPLATPRKPAGVAEPRKPAVAPIPIPDFEKSKECLKRSLDWFAKNQNADGSWGDSTKGAMTGLALLAFLAHGDTDKSEAYGGTVKKAVTWILGNGAKTDGRLHMAKQFNQAGVYEHGMCTYALCEYYTMSKDERVIPMLKQAVAYIVEGQGPDGGWMYSYDRTANDLSVSGWQIQALRAAQLTKLEIPGVDAAFRKAMKYLAADKGPKGGYGYRGPSDKYSLTGAGIWCRLLGKAERAELRPGLEWMLAETEKSYPVKYQGEQPDLYAWYYHTRACMVFGGSAWTMWNKWFQGEITNAQSEDGSWPPPGGKGVGPQSLNTKTGAVYRTALCTLMLEVFYRHLPTLQE
jgi:hypothetical protein